MCPDSWTLGLGTPWGYISSRLHFTRRKWWRLRVACQAALLASAWSRAPAQGCLLTALQGSSLHLQAPSGSAHRHMHSSRQQVSEPRATHSAAGGPEQHCPQPPSRASDTTSVQGGPQGQGRRSVSGAPQAQGGQEGHLLRVHQQGAQGLCGLVFIDHARVPALPGMPANPPRLWCLPPHLPTLTLSR